MKWQFNLQEGDSLDIGTGTKTIVITVGASVYLLTYLENNLRSREHKGKYWFWGADFHILGRNEDPVWVRGADLNTERTGDPTLEAYWLVQWTPGGAIQSAPKHFHCCPELFAFALNVIRRGFSHSYFDPGVGGGRQKGRKQHRFYLGTHFVEETQVEAFVRVSN